MSEELRIPKCGHRPICFQVAGDLENPYYFPWWIVRCDTLDVCLESLPYSYGSKKEIAIDRWNSRAEAK